LPALDLQPVEETKLDLQPADEPSGDPRAEIPRMAATGIAAAGDMVLPFARKLAAWRTGQPVEAIDKRMEGMLEQDPVSYRLGQGAGILATPTGKGKLAQLLMNAGFAGLTAAGDTRGDTSPLKAGGAGMALGAVLPPAAALALKPLGALAGKALPLLQRLEQKYAGKVLDASVKPAEATLRSATGTLGSLTAEGSRTLERLGMQEGLPAAEAAANKAVLATPEAGALATDLASKAREKLPGQLDRIEGGRGLVQQATQDVAAAKTPEAIAATEQRMRDYASDTLMKRYLLPMAGGAAAGAVLGGDEHRGTGATMGMNAGLLFRPGSRAILRQLSNPGVAAPITRQAVSIAQKLAGMATTQPQVLGKFAGPLAHAASRGDDAVAATHYILAQDPEYQDLMHAQGDEQ